MNRTIFVNTDGGARGNPGPAAIGVVIKTESQETLDTISKCIGTATNNQAEYTAVLEALNFLIEKNLACENIEFYLDSELVVKQLRGEYKLKNEGLKPLFYEIKKMIEKLNREITFSHITREKNAQADALVNQALDNREN